MTVKELKEKLNNYEDDLQVCIYDSAYYDYESIIELT